MVVGEYLLNHANQEKRLKALAQKQEQVDAVQKAWKESQVTLHVVYIGYK